MRTVRPEDIRPADLPKRPAPGLKLSLADLIRQAQERTKETK